MPQRGAAYQPRVKPWDSAFKIGRVLKERRIASSSQCPNPCPRHYRPDSDQSHGCSTTIILLWGKYSSLYTRHNLLSPRLHPRAPTGRRIPAQGETLGLGIQNRPRSEGTPHSVFIPVPHPCPRRYRPDSDQSHSTTSQVRPSYSMAWMTSKPTFWCALSERRFARAMSVTPH